MLNYLPHVLRLLSPAAIAFLTPDRARLLFKALMETIDAVAAKLSDKPLAEQAKEAEEAFAANIDLAFIVIPGFEEEKAELKTRLVPWLLSLIYGQPDDLTPDHEPTDAPEAP